MLNDQRLCSFASDTWLKLTSSTSAFVLGFGLRGGVQLFAGMRPLTRRVQPMRLCRNYESLNPKP